MRTPRIPTLLLTGSIALLIAGCGSTSTAPGPAEDQKTAGQIFADAITAFSSAPSVRENRTETGSTGSATIVVDATQNQARISLITGGTGYTLIIVGGRVYIGADNQFEEVTGANAAQVLTILPAKQAACNANQHGKLIKGAISTINGKRVIEILDDGKAPGGHAGSMFVALDGAPLPVRVVQTGPTEAGGDPACGAGNSTSSSSGTTDYDFTRAPVAVTAPPLVTPTPAPTRSATPTRLR